MDSHPIGTTISQQLVREVALLNLSIPSVPVVVAMRVAFFLLIFLSASVYAHTNFTEQMGIPHLFAKDALVEEIKKVDCTLSEGRKTQCWMIVVKAEPKHKMGPWCPRNVVDPITSGGMMFIKQQIVPIDGPFVKNAATFFSDPKWSLYDPKTGAIKVTDSKQACEMAARPDVAPQYNNYCVECLASYMGPDFHTRYLIPVQPAKAKSKQNPDGFSGYGVAFNGVKFDIAAPIGAILGAHTLAPVDACGGHVNPHVGYHYHAALGCSQAYPSAASHAAIVGVAIDGYLIYARENADGREPGDLDECRGHEFADLGYHYHANLAAENDILHCLKGVRGCALAGNQSQCDFSHRGPPGPPRR
ncbi:YHYH protein [Microbulbifer sp. JTAC008]|uniref:YHYH protein n=1 Tax=unclassified Microbulbifer TaxID=2619833 RepID=UPI00403A3580